MADADLAIRRWAAARLKVPVQVVKSVEFDISTAWYSTLTGGDTEIDAEAVLISGERRNVLSAVPSELGSVIREVLAAGLDENWSPT